ncbi:MAG: hypothetical protein KZQ99_09655 [Candidatus Thiodiazotropha sp. (ex Dulcina madagascariensis)]|nr:hypothetical protein [Candidatus Thiodiazotropha sp. (ex Dulcina madagascariensis)]
MKTVGTSKIATMIAGAAVFVSMAAQAVPPHLPNLVQGGNRWLITFYDDSSFNHNPWATQGLCFYQVGNVGTHTRYVWFSDTYPDWNGRATQEGDQIFMHGDYAADVGHDGMEWEIVTNSYKNEGAGHWKEWRENGGFGMTIGFGNAKFTRVGNCLHPDTISPNLADKVQLIDNLRLEYTEIPFPTAENGEKIVIPSGDGLSNDPESVMTAR